jgi:MoaA/NifB/PqqE/SkfB family radical SAM enzyme/polysaccharide pyruvyl transferase WcaK-like protein
MQTAGCLTELIVSLRKTLVAAIPGTLRPALRQVRTLGWLAWRDIRHQLLGQRWPMKPTVLSLMANDICNSRCEMCLIWERKRDKEISPDELRRLLSDPFFRNLEYVGITGGEPTLRKDLAELFRACCESLPKLKGATIITNAIQEGQVKERVLACASVCREHKISFAVMVSLDGVNEVHDRVRGRKDNFATARACLEAFRSSGLQTSFGCTITSSNAPYVDELMEWAVTNGFYGRFRMAEYIDRLYNRDVLKVIRSFDERTAYHLGLFFFRLEAEYESDSTYRKTYRSIRGMIAEGKRRQTGCPYQTHAVVIGTRGELMYCSPKSPNLGNVLESSPSGVYFGNLNQRRKLLKEHCDSCIHDYHDPVHLNEKAAFWLECRRRERQFSCKTLVSRVRRLSPPARRIIDPELLTSKNVLIVGWYGTETIGDKAILWSVIQRLRRRSAAPLQITVSSLYPFITSRTVEELGLNCIGVVETYSREFENAAATADEVVIGGGPLMDLEALNHMLYAFGEVRRHGGLCRIEGCGIGPLVEPGYIDVVRELFRVADDVSVRDEKSFERAARDFNRADARVVDDPAVEFVTSHQDNLPPTGVHSGPQGCVAAFLRDWGPDYRGKRTPAAFETLKSKFQRELAGMLAELAAQHEAPLQLFPMHCFHVGGDDRILNRKLRNAITAEYPEIMVDYSRLPVTPLEILTAMSRSRFNVCMRFHSVVFASTMGVPFLAIDYTNNGKIWSFLSGRNQLDHLITIEEIASGAWRGRLASATRQVVAEGRN